MQPNANMIRKLGQEGITMDDFIQDLIKRKLNDTPIFKLLIDLQKEHWGIGNEECTFDADFSVPLTALHHISIYFRRDFIVSFWGLNPPESLEQVRATVQRWRSYMTERAAHKQTRRAEECLV